MLRQRVITALILAPLFLALVLFAPPTLVAAVFALVTALAGVEWLALAGRGDLVARFVFCLLLVAAIALLWWLPTLRSAWCAAALLWWLAAAAAVLRYPQGVDFWHRPWLLLGSGLLVLPATWVGLVTVHGVAGPGALLLLFFVVWAADIGAYFAGRAFGQRKLAPHVSPGKSWEGAVGGMLFAVIVAVTTAWLGALASAPFGAVFVGAMLLLVVVSIFGDLVESMAKRAGGVKDSGGLLPGHGGVLDRIDSLLSTAPLWALIAVPALGVAR